MGTQTAHGDTCQSEYQGKIILKGIHISSMTDLLNNIGQILNTFINGLNNLINADLNGLEVFGLLAFPGIALTVLTKFVKHRR